MLASFLHSGIYYLADGLVLSLLVFIFYHRLWRRCTAVGVYLLTLLLIDGIARRIALYHYGPDSQAFFYFYWLSDIALAFATFLLICSFFRRVCANEAKMWRFVRLFLAFVFVLVLGIAAISLARNYASFNMYDIFIMEFQQDLYFACLVLNTLLYVLMQQSENAFEELGLLVCGLGLQFAGPAASFALVFLTRGHQQFATDLMTFLSPLCTLGMLLTWFYAVIQMSKPAKVATSKELVWAGAEGRRAA